MREPKRIKVTVDQVIRTEVIVEVDPYCDTDDDLTRRVLGLKAEAIVNKTLAAGEKIGESRILSTWHSSSYEVDQPPKSSFRPRPFTAETPTT